MVPTSRLVALAALGSVVVLLLPVPFGIVAVNSVLLVAFVVDALLAPRPGVVEVERLMPAGLTIGGGGGTITWRVDNPTSRRLQVDLADDLAPSLHASSRRVRVRVPPRLSVTTSADLHPVRRGRFELTELVVRVAGPMGLAFRQATRSVPATLRVLPPFRSRPEAELRIDKARIEIGLRPASGRGGGTDFDSLREYSIDDDSNRMDWAATARAAKPIVRTYRAERNQYVISLLDNGRVMAGQLDGVPRIEWGMDAVMTLTAVAARVGDRCGLVAFDREVRRIVPPRATATQLPRIIEAMCDLEPQLVESDYRGAFAATLARYRRRALLVLVTELAEEAVAETLLPALPLLLGRHLVIVASVVDPSLESWVVSPPADARGAYQSAAAVAAVARRAHTAARLRAMGATVIDAPPSLLSGRLADAYLRVKATARL